MFPLMSLQIPRHSEGRAVSLLRMSDWMRAAGRGACRMPSLLKAKASRSCEFAGEFKKLKLVYPAFKTQIPMYG